ncbi:hypothetical protein EBX31_05910 [bacterium]|nr:hypothetical protein [bacterium]
MGGRWVSPIVLRKNTEAVIRVIQGLPHRERPTLFEAATAIALRIFREERVDFVVWETGLGGRLDATNVVSPELCLLTSLGRDHEEILGRGYAKIGREKAGILKRGVPFFAVPWPKEAAKILHREARKLRCPWKVVRPLPAGIQAPHFMGQHQRWNLSLAREAGRYLGFPDRWIRRGLIRAEWPGRFQILRTRPPLVLDGAHNPEGVRVALQTWREKFGKFPGRIIFGCLKDKPADEMLGMVKKTGARIWGVALPGKRGSDPLGWKIQPTRIYADGVSAIKADQGEPALGGTLICGSLVLAGEVLQQRGWRPG